MAQNPFKKIALQPQLIPECLERNGAALAGIDTSKPSPHIYEYLVDGITHKFSLYILGNGNYTIGECSGFCKDTFKRFAEALINECAGDNTPFNYSKVNLAEKAQDIIDFLCHEGAIIEDDVVSSIGRRLRLRGPERDPLTITAHKNGTLQFQGKRLGLSIKLSDYLSNILSLDDALQSQIEIFSINLTVAEVKDQLSEVTPIACSYISEAVRIQMSSAMTLTRLDFEIEDYSFIAFPALRGLEGFIKDVLKAAGYRVDPKKSFGEYFIEGKMRHDQATHAGPTKARILNQCYSYWSDQRHRLFHMDSDTQTTRRLNVEEARHAVSHILGMIEESSKALLSEKP